MADTKKYLDLVGLTHYDEKSKEYIASSITTAIAGLEQTDTPVENQFVTGVSESNGKITVSRAALTEANIPDLTLSKITDAGTAAAADVATVAIGTESEAEDALPTVSQVKTYVTSQIGGLAGAMHFKGAVASLPATVEGYQAGDVIVITGTTKEYVCDGTKWVELGDESAFVLKTTKVAGIDLQDDITAKELGEALEVGVPEKKEGEAVIQEATGLFKAVADLESKEPTAITNDEIDALFATSTEDPEEPEEP